MTRALSLLGGVLLLAGCAAAGDSAALPMSLDVSGTEPFWSVEIRPTGMILSTPDKLETTFGAPTPTRDGEGHTVLAGMAADNTTLTVIVWPEACSDGMSDREYPYKATMQTTAPIELGDKTVEGCAAPEGYFKGKP